MFDNLAKTIDQASDERDIETLKHALSEIDQLLENESSSLKKACLYFYSANCHSMTRFIKGDTQKWFWEDENLEREIYLLRLSLGEFKQVPIEIDGSDLRFRVETNLANALNHVGRFVEALEYWDNVIKYYPNFSMAIGNRGYCLSSYARYLYDPGQQPIFLNESFHQIRKALDLGVEKHAEKGLREWLDHLLTLTNWTEYEFTPKKESKGSSKLEQSYRTWCIDKRLFLNPLNDISTENIVANDVLTFPSIVTQISRQEDIFPEVYGIYNQLKQEYVSARYIIFEAIEESKGKLHFADRRVKLYDLLDYRKYRLWIEKLKMAFLSVYAIFEKISYLINVHWELGIKVQKIKFNTVWRESGNYQKPFYDKLVFSENWPLRGLFWLSKDLYFGQKKSQPIEPEARQLNYIRNHIAHKYLRVYDSNFVDATSSREKNGHYLSYSINDEEFITHSIKLLILVRSALIYLSLAAYSEESISKRCINERILPIDLHEIEDSFRL